MRNNDIMSATSNKNDILKCCFKSLLCGFALAMTLVLRPVISFYLSNEGEFWFSLSSVIPSILMIFGTGALVTALIHFILPEGRRINPRLLFAGFVATIVICAYVQNAFLSSYLPLLTGDPIDWSQYTKWNAISIAMWIGVFVIITAIVVIKPQTAKTVVYALLAILLSMQIIVCGGELLTAKHENKRNDSYFSKEGFNETSESGNIVVLVSDTFEGTYMNELLERYPEYKDMLSDCTYYDNTTGISVFTYLSYANLMTGVDFPLGAASQPGLSYCFDNETTVSTVTDNGWDVAYYVTFSPTENVTEKILNACDNAYIPDNRVAWQLSKMLVSSTLFQSVPHPMKKWFIVYTHDYDKQKELLDNGNQPEPYVEMNKELYDQLTEDGFAFKRVTGKPRYSILELWGVHEPSKIDADFNWVEFDDSVSIKERKIQGARAQLKMLRAYLDRLKEAGTYDQTTVIMVADHGFDMRLYPTLIVKEAGRETTEFQIDHTPLSMREDYAVILDKITRGVRFSDAVAELDVPVDRVRYGVDYYSPDGYGEITGRKSLVTIDGDAKLADSYHVEKDEYYLNDKFPGRYKVGSLFLEDGKSNESVAVYGLRSNGEVTGHTALFDIFLEKENEEPLVLKVKANNITDQGQRVIISVNGAKNSEEMMGKHETRELSINIPDDAGKRITVELSMPDAVLRPSESEIMGWVLYWSLNIQEAGLYKNDV